MKVERRRVGYGRRKNGGTKEKPMHSKPRLDAYLAESRTRLKCVDAVKHISRALGYELKVIYDISWPIREGGWNCCKGLTSGNWDQL
jgi:hypothetical protein